MTSGNPARRANQPSTASPSGSGSESATSDGDLTDMLSELRVMLPTAQLLSAFLITVPFNSGFSSVVASEKRVFLATFLCAIAGLALLSAPAVQHRILAPLRERDRFKRFASRQIIGGAAFLSLALVLATELVLSEVFGHETGIAAASGVALLIVGLWWVLPKSWQSRSHPDCQVDEPPRSPEAARLTTPADREGARQ